MMSNILLRIDASEHRSKVIVERIPGRIVVEYVICFIPLIFSTKITLAPAITIISIPSAKNPLALIIYTLCLVQKSGMKLLLHESITVDFDDGFGKRLRRFLWQIMPYTAGNDPVCIFAREFSGIGTAIGIALGEQQLDFLPHTFHPNTNDPPQDTRMHQIERMLKHV